MSKNKQHKTCPHCAEEIKAEAKICKHCKTNLEEEDMAMPQTNSDDVGIMKMKSSLSSKQLHLFQIEYDKNKKSTGIAYLLWFFLGALGLHHLYLKDYKHRYFIVGIILSIILISTQEQVLMVIGGGIYIFIGVYLIYDLFTLPRQTKEANNRVEKDILLKIT